MQKSVIKFCMKTCASYITTTRMIDRIKTPKGLDGTQAAAELLDVGEAQLWVAAKDFPKGQKVSGAMVLHM